MGLKYILLVSVEIVGDEKGTLKRAYHDAYDLVEEHMRENYPDREIELESSMSLGREPYGDTYKCYCRLFIGIDE